MSETKPKRKTIPKSVKDKLWNDTFGKEAGIADCYCCKTEIDSKVFHAGHIVSVAHGGSNDISNLKPICSTCNLSMGTQNLEEFKEERFGSLHNTNDNDDAMEWEPIYNTNFNKCDICNNDLNICNKTSYQYYKNMKFDLDKCVKMCSGYIERQFTNHINTKY